MSFLQTPPTKRFTEKSAGFKYKEKTDPFLLYGFLQLQLRNRGKAELSQFHFLLKVPESGSGIVAIQGLFVCGEVPAMSDLECTRELCFYRMSFEMLAGHDV